MSPGPAVVARGPINKEVAPGPLDQAEQEVEGAPDRRRWGRWRRSQQLVPQPAPPATSRAGPDPAFPKDVLWELVGGWSRALESGTKYRYPTPGECCDQVTGISVTTSGASLARPRSKAASFACRRRARAAK